MNKEFILILRAPVLCDQRADALIYIKLTAAGAAS